MTPKREMLQDLLNENRYLRFTIYQLQERNETEVDKIIHQLISENQKLSLVLDQLRNKQ